MPTQKEIDRRYTNIRAAMTANNIDGLIVGGNQYAGFEGAIRYVSGFEIVHRYVYVLIPLSGEPTLVFPREARWIRDKKAPWVRDQVWAEIPGKWLREKMEEKKWKRVAVYDPLLYSLEVTGEAGYWVEFSRALIRGKPSARTLAMSDVYPEAMEAARFKMREGALACDVHKAAADVFQRAGFALGHLTGHSIGLTMIEHPAIGANTQVELKENMVVSFHPQVVDQDGQVCLYTQDTYRIGKKQGECLASLPWKFYSGAEASKTA